MVSWYGGNLATELAGNAAGKLNAFSRLMSNNTVTNQSHLPDTEICRTRYVVQSDLSQCLVENSDACGFAIRFGSGVICRHPQRRSFEKTDPPLPLQ
jgi:hypothetical protein